MTAGSTTRSKASLGCSIGSNVRQSKGHKTRRSFTLHTRAHTHATDSQLCGQHALNALLQGSLFTAPDLAEIGHALDEKERELMLAAGADTEDAIRFAAEESGYGSSSSHVQIQTCELM